MKEDRDIPPREGFAGLTVVGIADAEETEKLKAWAEVEKAELTTVGFEVTWRGREVGIWVEKVLRVVEVEGILVDRVEGRRRVKAELKGACVVLGPLEGGDLVVDPSRGAAAVEVGVGVISGVDVVATCGLAVDLFGVSSNFVSGVEKGLYFSHSTVAQNASW